MSGWLPCSILGKAQELAGEQQILWSSRNKQFPPSTRFGCTLLLSLLIVPAAWKSSELWPCPGALYLVEGLKLELCCI